MAQRMATEEILMALLRTHVPKSYPGKAPPGTTGQYLVWTHIGGTPLRALDGTPGNIRNSQIQINVWDEDTQAAFTKIRAIEDALYLAPPLLFAESLGEPIDAMDDLLETRGALQRFSIWGPR